jgi:hypothetical protein
VLRDAPTNVQIAATAIYSDGSREDVTPMAVYSSNDEGVLKVNAAGLVTPQGGTGDAAIMVRYAGQFAAAVYGATTLPALKKFAPLAQNVVDHEIYAKLADLNITPAPPAGDEEFIRRVYLDILGTLPSAADVRQFVSSAAPDKRSTLIDQVLERPEYADLQTLIWADRLRSDSRFHRVGGVRSYYRWLHEEFASNRPLDKFARALVTAKGPSFTFGAANYWGNYDKISTPIETAIQTGQVFLGVRIGCAQCHNHPFEKWSQTDFYSVAAVFSQVVEFSTKNAQEFDLRIDPNRAVIHPVTKQAAIPRPLGGREIDPEPGIDRRIAFADWLTSKENPFFARAMANLIWRNMMGRGLVNPVDDMRDTNPATHPRLLDALAKELSDHRFDQMHLIRLIANSQTYQHSSEANETNRLDFKYYSRSYPKRMMAEVYMDAVAQVTGVRDAFKDWPEAKRALQLPDSRTDSYFLKAFGRPDREKTCECERTAEPNVAQMLHLANGDTLNQKLMARENVISKHLTGKEPPEKLVEVAYLRSLSRYPTNTEKEKILRVLADAGKDERRPVIEDMYWALLSSKEFLFNH